MPHLPDSLPARCRDCIVRSRCILGRLPDAEASAIHPLVREKVSRRGAALAIQGEVSDCLRVLKIGTVFCYRRGLDGRSRPIGVVSQGTALGTFAILGQPSPASCISLSGARTCELPLAALRATPECHAKLVSHAAQAIVDNFAAVSAWSEAMRLHGVVNQLAYVLLLLGEAQWGSTLELPSQSDLSLLLGARRETVARALRTLQDEGGLVRHERKRCEIVRARLLERLGAVAP